MSPLPPELAPYIAVAAPPLVGAFIGYLTNKIAIRMLFRPLRAWHILGIRVPMTPGVIPSQRRRLAMNMGEVVGDHLLTSDEIGKGLQEEKFQQHLLNVIAERVGNIFHRDLPPLPELVPVRFAIYRELGIKTLKQQLRETISRFLQSPEFGEKMNQVLKERFSALLKKRVEDIFRRDSRIKIYDFLEDGITRMMTSQTMTEWLDDMVRRRVYEMLQQERSLKDILPASVVSFGEESIRKQTPNLMSRLAAILSEAEVRDGFVRGACRGVEQFILSLGPMAPMVQNFISMEVVEQKIRQYLEEKEGDIRAYLASNALQEKVAAIFAERFATFMARPLVEMVDVRDTEIIEAFCSQTSRQIALALQSGELSGAIATMIHDNLEIHLENGDIEIGKALKELLGHEGVLSLEAGISREGLLFLRSQETMKVLGAMLDSLVDSLLARRIGKLSRFLPSDVRREIYVSIQKLTAAMLAKEVPGLVASLDIKKIVAEKIDSLDLLRLERLLLSIMEEQFKYINLFGALLGFLIGCLNLLLLRFG